MRSINPSVKIVALILDTFIMAYWHHPIINISVFIISMILIVASGAKIKNLIIALIPILLCAIGMFMTGFRYAAGSNMPVNDNIMMFASSRVWNGMILASRVLAFAAMGYLYMFTTDRIRMIKSFEQQLKLPTIMAYGVMAAWGIFPQMAREYKRTILAFKARGLRVIPLSPAILKPMLVKSVRWSEELAVAMESKGFSGKEKRSRYASEKIGAGDIVMLVICVVIFPVLCYLIGKGYLF